MEQDPTVTGEFTGRYTIERELGRGGAAIVYLAYDNRQERQVALKMLHKELAQAIGAKRFLREIKHSSSLQHPHLLTILDSGESRGRLYFVMPYMPDGSLRARIAKEKQLPVDDAIAITRDVGEALAYAHSRGIVHRDIKPDNVLFSGNHACLADFGIARAMDSVAADTLTSTGLVVGTPAYMSPEQASGEKTVDARSDQYSLACLLYEMVTGLPPFIGATQQSVISQRFTQPPPSMRAHRPNVPEHVERAVKRALAIVPADRFASVTEFIAALGEPAAVAAPVSTHAIRRRWFAVGAAAALVVLAVMAADPGKNWFRGAFGAQVDTSKFVVLPFQSEEDPAEGERIGAGLYSALSTWEDLPLERDIAVRAALAERDGKVEDLDAAIEVARKLGIGRLIWGRVTTDGGVSRVHADLYDVAGKRSLNERTVTADSAGFSEEELRALANSLLAYEPVPAGADDGQSGTRSFPAWQAYMRAVGALSRWQLDSAERDLIVATEADADFAVAQLRLAQVANWLRSSDDQSWTANARRAAVLRAELTERDALLADALLAFGNREYDVACPRFREIVRRDTMDAVAWFSLGGCLRADDAVVPHRGGPSAWSFRTSYHSAGKAFLRAFELEPKLHAIPRFDWVRAVFPTGRNQTRAGSGISGGPRDFRSRPLLVAETLAYVPYPETNWEREQDSLSQSRRTAALARNAEVLLGVTTLWARNFPRSSEAFRELAAVREARGERTGPTAETGALQALARARELAATTAENLAIGESQVRVLLKLKRFPAARALADSILNGLGPASDSNWRSVVKLAGLTGRSTAFESALQYFWARFVGVDGLDQTVATAGAELLGRSILGLCGPPVNSAEARLRRLMESSVQPDQRANVHKGVLSYGLSYMVACTDGLSMAKATRDRSLITRAQTAFASGNIPRARALLDTLATNREAFRAGEMSINLSAREAMLRLHMGDTATAVVILDMTLAAIETISPSSFEQPLDWAMLVRTMVLRADLAANAGDANTAARWARSVMELWRNADYQLKPTLARMERLSQMRQANSR